MGQGVALIKVTDRIRIRETEKRKIYKRSVTICIETNVECA